MKNSVTMFSKKNQYLLWIFAIFFFSQSVTAQIVLEPDYTKNKIKILSCATEETQIFTDDGTIDGLYQDTIARLDTIILCPDDSLLYQIKLTFNEFDIAPGDNLKVYDCNLQNGLCAVKATASGPSVSSAFGGWVKASCDRTVNSSGCLSFVFETNGDNSKGTGWAGLISCENDKTEIECPENISVIGTNLDGSAQVTILKPTITTCDDNASNMVTIASSCSIITEGAVVADGSNLGTFTIPLGIHTITATSIDSSASCTYRVSVDQPALVCNDEINVSNNGSCQSTIGVDDFIESPIVGAGISYFLEIDLGIKDGGVISTTIDGTNLTTLNAGGLDVNFSPKSCGTKYPIKITRTINVPYCRDSEATQPFSQTCAGKIVFGEEEPFVIPKRYSVITCTALTAQEIVDRIDLEFSCNVETSTTILNRRFPNNLCVNNVHAELAVTLTSYCGITVIDTLDVFVNRQTNFTTPEDTTYGCNEELDPDDTGYPRYDSDGDGTIDAVLDEIICDLIPTYRDTLLIDATTNQRRVLRTWIIRDRCNVLEDVVLPSQTISNTGRKPVIDCPSDSIGTFNKPLQFYTTNGRCETNVQLTNPSTTDECGGSITVFPIKTVNVINQTIYTTTDTILPIGKYYTQYVAKNESTGGVSDTCLVYFVVSEPGGLQAICKGQINVSFVDGKATVSVNGVDKTEDNCNVYTKEIRKEGGEFGERVSLNCQEVDAGTKIHLRIRDITGQENTCWTNISAKDIIVPICETLPDLTFDCKDFDYGQFGFLTDNNNNNAFDEDEWEILLEPLASVYAENFGAPICGDNLSLCFEPLLLQQYQLIPASCGETKIKRRYAAIDLSGNLNQFKEQLITLTYEPDFAVNFPADWEGSCGDDFPAVDSLEVQAYGCNILVWDHEDKIFDNTDGACFVLERTYTVVNWCRYEVGEAAMVVSRTEDEKGFSVDGKSVTHETLANVGSFSYTQILKITDSAEPTIILEPVETCLLGNECSQEKTFTINATDCVSEAELTYSYELSTNGNILENGEGNTFATAVSNQPYEVKWQVQDNCGNTAWKIENYTFEDCKKPSAVCLEVSINIDNSGSKTAAIWATDLNQKSFDNCTSEEIVELRLWHPSIANEIAKPQNEDTGSEILALPKSITLDCNFIGDQAIELYAIDEAGNWDYCTGSVQVQDANNACNSGEGESENESEGQAMAVVSGKVLNINGSPLNGVNLLAKSSTNEDQIFQTNAVGAFELNLPVAQDYTITLDKEDAPTNGVSTFDLVLISKHILGIQPFDTPYKYLAADVNLSQTITAYDMVVLRQIILNIKPNFDDNRSWRFVEATHEFGSNNPMSEDFAESIIISELTQDLTKMDYIALKKGDVNGSVQTDNLIAAQPRSANGNLWINLQDKFVKKGERVEVNLLLKDIENLQGFQFALDFPNLTLDNVESDLINTKHMYQRSDNELAISWDKFSANANSPISATENLLKLYFTIEKSGQLSDLFRLSTSMNTEAIDSKDNLFNLALNFEPIDSRSSKLFQNIPNPFKEKTIIGFQLAQAGPVKIEIFNLQGKQLKVIENNFDAGYNELPVHKNELTGNGVLWYRMQTLDGMYARKMVLLQ